MQYLFMGLFALVAVAADQLSKLWVVHNIAPTAAHHALQTQQTFGVTLQQQAAMPQSMGGIDGVFHFAHTHNEGAAWSSFEGMRWLFVAIFLAFTLAIVWEFSKKRMNFTNFERWCIAIIYAGGLGNVIDRVVYGYVVDMIAVDFIDFPVFNVADCFITVGCIALLVHLIFFNRKFWKDEKK